MADFSVVISLSEKGDAIVDKTYIHPVNKNDTVSFSNSTGEQVTLCTFPRNAFAGTGKDKGKGKPTESGKKEGVKFVLGADDVIVLKKTAANIQGSSEQKPAFAYSVTLGDADCPAPSRGTGENTGYGSP